MEINPTFFIPLWKPIGTSGEIESVKFFFLLKNTRVRLKIALRQNGVDDLKIHKHVLAVNRRMVAIRELPYCKTCADAAKKSLRLREIGDIDCPFWQPPYLPSSLPPYPLTPLPPTQKLHVGKLRDSTYKCLYQAFLPLY